MNQTNEETHKETHLAELPLRFVLRSEHLPTRGEILRQLARRRIAPLQLRLDGKDLRTRRLARRAPCIFSGTRDAQAKTLHFDAQQRTPTARAAATAC